MRIEHAVERDDSELVSLARDGDRKAFKLLVQRYQQRVYGIAYGIVRNEEDALDISQQAFIKVHKHLPRFQGTSSFYTWLYRIVVNLCIDHKRRAARSMTVDYDDALDHEGGVASVNSAIAESPFRDPAKELAGSELRRELGRAMDGLSEKHRQVILLREIEGLSYKEIAEVLDISVGTVMSRLHHARHNLQSALRRYLKRE